jgi:DNA-binding protein YbaB
MKINEVVTEGLGRGLLKTAAVVGKMFDPETGAKLQSYYAQSDPNYNNSDPLQSSDEIRQQMKAMKEKMRPTEVTTSKGIKLVKIDGKWVRQDDNTVITDPTEIKKIEQLVTNKQQLAIARGYPTK